jgi:MerR family transcriptional regulator, light-induced transcriptional regulator
MSYFSIRDIENLCNIRAHTLRIWEQRYGLFIPTRKESQHRIYSNEDLKSLLRISFLYHQGFKISKIAALSAEQISQLVATAEPAADNHELFINQLITASLEFDKEAFERIVNAQLRQLGLENCIRDIFYPFLNRIGMLWLTNHVIPAQEHFSSHIIRKKIICATDRLPQETSAAGHVLVFAPAGEFHEIPLLCANYFWRQAGIRTTYFGINVPVEAIQFFLERHSCSFLHAHIISKLNLQALGNYFKTLEEIAGDTKLILSGPGAVCLQSDIPNAMIISSMQELIQFAHEAGMEAPVRS